MTKAKCTKKLWDPENTLDPESNKIVAERLKEGSINKVPSGTGLLHGRGARQKISRNKAPNEKTIENEGAYIVLGTDQPAGITSGKGALGAQGAACIDLVVGIMSSVSDRLPAASIVDRNFAADAARIYISQLTDIDKNFGLSEGHKDRTNRSGIGIKADGVRIIGREGVKIVTGGGRGFKGFPNGKEPNSLGGALLTGGGKIELIAGNSTEPRRIARPLSFISSGGSQGRRLAGRRDPAQKDMIEIIETLQPILLGDNTRDALKELVYNIGHIWSALFALAMIDLPKDAAIGVDPLRSWVPTAIGASTTYTMSNVVNSLWHARTNIMAWEMNYLTNGNYKYICSTNVSAT